MLGLFVVWETYGLAQTFLGTSKFMAKHNFAGFAKAQSPPLLSCQSIEAKISRT